MHLIGIDQEIFTNDRQTAGGTSTLQSSLTALKIILVRQNRQAGSTALRIGAGNRGRIEIFADNTFTGRGFLDFGDHRRLTNREAFFHCGDKPTRGTCIDNLFFELIDTCRCRAFGNLFKLAGQNISQNIRDIPFDTRAHEEKLLL